MWLGRPPDPQPFTGTLCLLCWGSRDLQGQGHHGNRGRKKPGKLVKTCGRKILVEFSTEKVDKCNRTFKNLGLPIKFVVLPDTLMDVLLGREYFHHPCVFHGHCVCKGKGNTVCETTSVHSGHFCSRFMQNVFFIFTVIST